jgi:DNA-binding CsgD family transcriptional regulator
LYVAVPRRNRADGLTPREVEILRLVTSGLTNRELADGLGVSTRTVDAHLRSVYAKLGVKSRSAATRYAIEHQLV